MASSGWAIRLSVERFFIFRVRRRVEAVSPSDITTMTTTPTARMTAAVMT